MLVPQIIQKKHTHKKQRKHIYSHRRISTTLWCLKSTITETTAGIQELALGEQVRRVTDCRKKSRSEMTELKEHQQQETGQAAISLTWEAIGHRTHTGIFESFKLEGSYVGDLLYP